MNFVWDMVLRAEAQGAFRERLFFRQAGAYSPYYEQSFPCLNQKDAESTEIELNALYRFSHIFQELLHPDVLLALEEAGAKEFVDFLFDFVMHALCEADLMHGLTKREYFVRGLRREILNGVYGRAAAEAFGEMDKPLQLCLAGELLTQMQAGTALLAFRRAVRAAFCGSILYQSNFDCKALYLYIGEKETSAGARRLQFILDMFLPLGFFTRVFWEHHFGIIGVDAVMKLDEIAIF